MISLKAILSIHPFPEDSGVFGVCSLRYLMTSAESQTMLEPQTHDQQRRRFAAQQTQLEEATVSDIGGMNDFTYIHYLLVSFSLVFAHADYGNDTHHVAKRPQSEWPKASTVRGPMVQVGKNPIFFVLIDNPISKKRRCFLPQF